MQIRQLEYLLKIVECGSITKAAEQLFISQPNLTKSIHQLEQEFHVEIFTRKPRGVELTPAGKTFVYYAKSVVTSAQALQNNSFSGSAPGTPRSTLFLATQQLDFVHDIFLNVYLDNRSSPLHYNLLETDRNDVVHQVLNGNVDCGLFVRNNRDANTFLWNTRSRQLHMEVLDQGESCVCVGPKSIYYQRGYMTVSEAELSTQVMLDMESAARRDLYFDNSTAKYDRAQIIFFNTVDACKRFILQTDAVLYLSKWSRGYFDYPRFRVLPLRASRPDEEVPVNDLVWVKRSDVPLSNAETLFLTYLHERLKK